VFYGVTTQDNNESKNRGNRADSLSFVRSVGFDGKSGQAHDDDVFDSIPGRDIRRSDKTVYQ
jgi:hypothetical protein